MQKWKLALMVVGVGLVAGVAQAQDAIAVVTNIAVIGPRVQTESHEITIEDWSLDGGNCVVAVFTAEWGVDFTASFGGQEMHLVESTNTDHRAWIGYLINPSVSSGDLVMTMNREGGNRISHAYAVFSLSGVGSVADSDTRTSNGTLGYTTELEGGHVIGVAINNNWNGPAPTVSGRPDQVLVSQAVDGNCSIVIAHGAIPDAGSYTDNYQGNVLAAATIAFERRGPPAGTLIIVR